MQDLILDTEHSLATRDEEAIRAAQVIDAKAAEVAEVFEDVRRQFFKDHLRAAVTELAPAIESLTDGMSMFVAREARSLIAERHCKARREARKLMAESEELRQQGLMGEWPTMSVYYHGTAVALRAMAEDAYRELDMKLLNILAQWHDAVSAIFARDGEKSVAALEKAREMQRELITERLHTA